MLFIFGVFLVESGFYFVFARTTLRMYEWPKNTISRPPKGRFLPLSRKQRRKQETRKMAKQTDKNARIVLFCPLQH